MLKKTLWCALLGACCWQARLNPDPLFKDSANQTVNGTGQVMPSRQTIASSQLFTSEAGSRALLAGGIIPIGTSRALIKPAAELSRRSRASFISSVKRYFAHIAPLSETGQLVLTCLGMAAFVLFAILRRLRHSQRAEHVRRSGVDG